MHWRQCIVLGALAYQNKSERRINMKEMERILVYHKIKPDFMERRNVDMLDFELVAAIDAPEYINGACPLDVAFELTNHIDISPQASCEKTWTENEEIWVRFA